MSKKSFKDINPATAFISSAQPLPPPGADYTHNTDNTHKPHKNPSAGETKSKRLNLLIKPSLLQDFSKVAHMKRASVNSLLNMLIADYVKKEAATIQQYNQTFKGE